MKKTHWMLKSCWLGLLFCCCLSGRAQIFDAQQLILDWEKLSQLKKLLNDMYEGYQIVEKGYTTIRDISHGNFDLHKLFLDGLLAVNPSVRQYYKVNEIIRLQKQLATVYRRTTVSIRADRHFAPEEANILIESFGRLLDVGTRSLDGLIAVLTDGVIRAADDDRLRQIDALEEDMRQKLGAANQLSNEAGMLSLARARDEVEREGIRKMYGLTK